MSQRSEPPALWIALGCLALLLLVINGYRLFAGRVTDQARRNYVRFSLFA